MAGGKARLVHGLGKGVVGIVLIQILWIKGGQGGDRGLGRCTVSRQESADNGGAVDTQGQGAAQGLVIEGRLLGVEADIVENGGVGVLEMDAAGDADGLGAGEVGSDELHLMGGELIEHGVPVCGGGEGNGIHRQRRALPPMRIALQPCAPSVLREGVGAGPHRHSGRGGGGFDDGDVQQGGEAGVGPAEHHGDAFLSCGDGADLREAGAIAGGGFGPLERLGHILGSQGAAVGKENAGAEGEHIGEGFRIIGIAGAEDLLGLQGGGELEQPFVQKPPDHLLHPVGAGDGVQGLTGRIGQGEAGGQGYRLFLGVGVFQRVDEQLSRVRLVQLVLPAAAKTQHQRQRAAKGQKPSFHTYLVLSLMVPGRSWHIEGPVPAPFSGGTKTAPDGRRCKDRTHRYARGARRSAAATGG